MTKIQALNWAIIEVENRYHQETRDYTRFDEARQEYEFAKNKPMVESLTNGIKLAERNMQRCNEVLAHLAELKNLVRQGGMNV
jgi:hypothetical protein